jgi:hypothetical protein
LLNLIMTIVTPRGELGVNMAATIACTLFLCLLRHAFVTAFGLRGAASSNATDASCAAPKLPKPSRWGDPHATALFKGCYFVVACAGWWSYFGNKDWVFVAFGGPCIGTAAENYCGYDFCGETWDNAMVAVGAHSELRTYYTIQLAYHLHSTFFHFMLPRRPDFVAMTLHHIFTLCLVGCSFALNDWYRAFGSIVLFANDASDIGSYALKVTEGIGRVSVILSAYVFVLLSWAYFRLYALPSATIFLLPILSSQSLLTWGIGLGVIHLLHIHWFWKVLAMGIGYARHGEVKDHITGPGSPTCKPKKHL